MAVVWVLRVLRVFEARENGRGLFGEWMHWNYWDERDETREQDAWRVGEAGAMGNNGRWAGRCEGRWGNHEGSRLVATGKTRFRFAQRGSHDSLRKVRPRRRPLLRISAHVSHLEILLLQQVGNSLHCPRLVSMTTCFCPRDWARVNCHAITALY